MRIVVQVVGAASGEASKIRGVEQIVLPEGISVCGVEYASSPAGSLGFVSILVERVCGSIVGGEAPGVDVGAAIADEGVLGPISEGLGTPVTEMA